MSSTSSRIKARRSIIRTVVNLGVTIGRGPGESAGRGSPCKGFSAGERLTSERRPVCHDDRDRSRGQLQLVVLGHHCVSMSLPEFHRTWPPLPASSARQAGGTLIHVRNEPLPSAHELTIRFPNGTEQGELLNRHAVAIDRDRADDEQGRTGPASQRQPDAGIH